MNSLTKQERIAELNRELSGRIQQLQAAERRRDWKAIMRHETACQNINAEMLSVEQNSQSLSVF